MLLQLLSDLHLETEAFDPQPVPGADVLVLAGDIDSRWTAYRRFQGWPVPVLVVPGNHEFDRRELSTAVDEFKHFCRDLGLLPLEGQVMELSDRSGRRVRFVGTVRWTDFEGLGAAERPRALKAAGYFQKVMSATHHGQPFDAEAVAQEGQRCKHWLREALATPHGAQATVVVTHFAPSLRSADPRYGRQPGTASFCNADDDLMPGVDLWLHGHVHARHHYTVEHGPGHPPTRVVCQARGLERKGEAQGFDAQALFSV